MIWTNTTFTPLWPIGGAAVVSAKTAQEAADLLNHTLEQRGIHQEKPVLAKDMVKFSNVQGNVAILSDGNY